MDHDFSLNDSKTWWEWAEEFAGLSDTEKKMRSHGDNLAKAISERAERIKKSQEWIFQLMKVALETYSGRCWNGNEWALLTPGSPKAQEVDEELSTDSDAVSPQNINFTQNIVDTARAQITMTQPRVLVSTYRSHAQLRRSSKKLQKVFDGVFETKHAYERLSDQVLDAACYGVGIMKPRLNEEGEVYIDRVFRGEMLIDETIAHPADLREVGQEKMWPIEMVLASFPDCDEDAVRQDASDVGTQAYGLTKQVRVREFWHLKSGKDTDDGWRVIATDSAVLAVEPYKRPTFPFVFYFWTTPNRGFTPHGLVETLLGVQLEADGIANKFQRSARLTSYNAVYKHKSCEVISDNIAEDGLVVVWDGPMDAMPVRQAAPPMNPQLLQYLQWIVGDLGYALAGTSSNVAQGQRLTSHMSGESQRTHFQIAGVRYGFQTVGHGNAAVDLADRLCDLFDEAEESGQKVKVLANDNKFIEELDWKMVRMERSQFRLRRQVGNVLPDLIEGRRQLATEMVSQGMLTPEQAVGMLSEAPDFDHLKPVSQRHRDAAEMLLDQLEDWVLDAESGEMPDRDKPIPIDHINIAIQLEIATRRLLDLEVDGDFESMLHDSLIEFVKSAGDVADEQQKKMQMEQMQMQQAMAPAQPAGAAGPPPQR